MIVKNLNIFWEMLIYLFDCAKASKGENFD